MLEAKIFGVIMDILLDILMIGICTPLRNGNIQRNALFGFRFRASLRSDEAWKQTNQYGARWMIRWGIALIIFSIIVLVLPVNNDILVLLFFYILPIVFVIIPTVQAYRFAQRFSA